MEIKLRMKEVDSGDVRLESTLYFATNSSDMKDFCRLVQPLTARPNYQRRSGGGTSEKGQSKTIEPKMATEEMGGWRQKALQSMIITCGGVKSIGELEKLAIMKADGQFRNIFISSQYFPSVHKAIPLPAHYARTLSMIEFPRIHFNNSHMYEHQLGYMSLVDSVQLLHTRNIHK